MRTEDWYPYGEKELLEQMKRLAAAYTPEWRMDTERPDVGTALAMIYADMFEGTVRRYNRLPEKNRSAFFQEVGTELKPAVPAQGYVAFGLASDDLGGTEVPKGLLVTAPGEEEVPFETQDSVYVTPAALEEIYLTDGANDRIQRMYRSERAAGETGDAVPFPFYLFQSGSENLQAHVFTAGQDEVLNLKGPARVYLKLRPCRGEGQDDDIRRLFLDPQATAFEYLSEEGYVPFGGRNWEKDCLVLELDPGCPPAARTVYGEQEGRFLRCRLLKPCSQWALSVEEFRISSSAEGLAPDVVQTEMGEAERGEVFPFGERPMPYAEVYIASDQVLSKRGARVRMEFRMDYEKVPLETAGETERDWKLVMKREDFVPDPEYDVTIERVIWEYYNGSGWSRLFTDQEYSRIFNGGDGTMGQQFSLEFVCPEDAEPFLYNSTLSRYIRVRVLKMNNLFKQNGHYITPVMSDIRFSFAYKGLGKFPDYLEAENCLSKEVFPAAAQARGPVRWNLFYGIGEPRMALYMRFSKPLDEGPIKMLFTMEESIPEEMPRLAYEYLSAGGFQPLPVMDETESMRRSGVVTFMGRPDFERAVLWGSEGCWLRLTDADDGYRRKTARTRIPVISGIFLNAARIRAVRTMPEERFRIELREKNKVCTLPYDRIQDLEVWVDESRERTAAQMAALAETEQVRREQNADGEITAFWVKWKEVDDFCLSGPEDRHYTADRNRGTVQFSDGVMGAIPASGPGETIRICYSRGGGENGNQPEGSVSQMPRTLGYINRAYNPRVTMGGCDQETAQEAIIRSERRFRHRDRAVTVSDYEALGMESSRSVLKVRCFSNCGENGRREPGSVTLVVLQKNFKDGRIYFDQVKQEVLQYMRSRIPGNQQALERFYVVEPQYLELRCRIEIAVGDFDQVFEVRRRVLERIEKFLDPIRGNFDGKGWQIGRIPNEIQISNAMKGIEGILYIKEVQMSAFVQSRQGWVEVDKEAADERRFAVALSGAHQIFITVEN